VTRVLVAASAAICRPGLASRLGAHKSLNVVVGAPGLSLSEQIEEAQPDVVLLHVGGERVAGLLGDTEVGSWRPAIVAFADDVRGAARADWLRADAVRAVLPRRATVTEIIAAIDAVSVGLVVLHPDTMPFGESARPRAPGVGSQPLTPREIEVLGMMAEGLGNKIIAARLDVSLHTVKFHIASIFAKLGAGSRTEAVTIAVRQGLIMI
jgi:NarL family two-component system response regulator YdfI